MHYSIVRNLKKGKEMPIATMTSKGQITIPVRVREALQLEAGEKVDFRIDEESGIALMVPLNRGIDLVFGCLHRPGKPALSPQQMDEAIAGKVRRRR